MQTTTSFLPTLSQGSHKRIPTHTQYSTKHSPTERWGSLASTWQSHRFEFQTKFESHPASFKDKQHPLNLPSFLTCQKNYSIIFYYTGAPGPTPPGFQHRTQYRQPQRWWETDGMTYPRCHLKAYQG